MTFITPTWMLSEAFTQAWQQMENDEITVKEFSEKLDAMKDVPEPVKESWRKNAKWYTHLSDMRQNTEHLDY